MTGAAISVDSIADSAAEGAQSWIDSVAKMSPQQLWETYRGQMLNVLIILVLGYFIVKIVVAGATHGLKKSRLDKSSHAIILASIRLLLWIVVLLTAASALDIPMNSTLALFSVFALAFSLAVKDSLSQVAGGILILASKPFSVGDVIESKADNVVGTVMEIGLIHTRLKTFDNKQVYIPNGALIASTVINYTGAGVRRLDLTFSISYDDNFEQAKKIILDLVGSHPYTLYDSMPVVRVTELAESSVNIICRVWVDKENFEALRFDLLEQVKTAFDKAGIVIPYRQLDLHMSK